MTLFVRRTLAIAAVALTAACARREGGPAGAARGESTTAMPEHFHLSVTRSGGIAGMLTTATYDGDTRRYERAERGAPVVSGELPADSVRTLARLVVDSVPEMKADYGRTPNAADMFEYVVEATWGSEADGLNSYTVRADDGTAPDALRRIVSLALDAAIR